MNKHIEEAMRLFDKASHADVSVIDSYSLASISSSLIAIAMMMEEQNEPVEVKESVKKANYISFQGCWREVGNDGVSEILVFQNYCDVIKDSVIERIFNPDTITIIKDNL